MASVFPFITQRARCTLDMNCSTRRLLIRSTSFSSEKSTPCLSAIHVNARMSFGRQYPPYPIPGAQEIGPNSRVHPHAPGDVVHISARGLAKVCNHVGEGDLR